jgi:uncharacterized membrane protein
VTSKDKQPANQNSQDDTKTDLDTPNELIELLNLLDEEQIKETLALIEEKHPHILSLLTSTSQFVGPIPPPHLLKEYEETLNGAAKKIINMAEKSLIHRQWMEKEVLNASYKVESRGQHYALIVSLVGLIGGMVLINNGHEFSGFFLSGATLIGLAYVFITGRQPKRKTDSEDNLE